MAEKKFRTEFPIMKTFLESLPEPVIDEATSKITYKGYAYPGVDYDKPGWLIIKETKTNATSPYGLITREYASYEFDQVWNNRAGLTYSR